MRFWLVTSVVIGFCLLGCGANTPKPESNVKWIDPKKIQSGPTLHESLSDELLSRIKSVHTTFAEVDGTPLEKWIDDFKRDLDPEGNVRIWEDMQVAYNAYCSDRELPLASRKEVFKVVLMRSMMSDDEVIARLKPTQLAIEDIRTILDAYPSSPKPVEVIERK